MTRLESFPFTSHDDGYDAAGYPVYDRAVDSRVLRETFAKFFTNGVFPSPGTALQIGKASTGLAVTVQPGICIINGAMGGVNGDDPVTLTLDTAAPQGNVCYSIMLRYDNTDSFTDSRSILLNVVRGDAGENPVPPTPDTSTPEVYELRLGYVTVPSGATDLSEATVTNEKGLAVCPYAAPFEDIDLSQVVADAQAEASQALTALNEYIETNMSFIESAIDGTTAGNLQNQITALQQQLDDFDLSGSVDNETIEYTPAAGSAQDKLRVMLQETRAAMGLGDTLGALPVSSGGTGVTDIDSLLSMFYPVVESTSVEITINNMNGYAFDVVAHFQSGVDIESKSFALVTIYAYKKTSGTYYQLVGVIPISAVKDVGSFKLGDMPAQTVEIENGSISFTSSSSERNIFINNRVFSSVFLI